MRFKQYAGKSVAELAPRIREELGPEAVILKQRPLRTGGIGGFFARVGVEVLAADGAPADTEAALQAAIAERPSTPHVDTADAPQESTDELLRATFSEALEARVTRAGEAAPAAPAAVASALLPPLAEPEPAAAPPTGAYAPPAVRRFEPVRIDATSARGGLRLAAAPALVPDVAPLGDEADDLVLELDRAGVPRSAATELVCEVQRHVAPFAADGDLRELVRARMAARIRTEQGWADGHGTRRIAILGDAGVGKTSAVARLAAAYTRTGLSVGLLLLQAPAVDEHPLLPRLGATVGSEADRVLAYMAGADILRAETPLEVRRAVKRFVDRDVLLVDTPSLGSSEATLRDLLAALDAHEVHAVVPLALSEREADATVARMSRLGADRLLVSKTDEARFAGPLYGLAARFDLPLSYVGVGARVPGDLAHADGASIALRILPI
jgi:flagellar biosynthesis protein FlhF